MHETMSGDFLKKNQTPKAEKRSEFSQFVAKIDSDASLKDMRASLENYIREHNIQSLDLSLVPATLMDIQETIARGELPSMDQFDSISNVELAKKIKDAAAYELAFALGKHASLEALVGALGMISALSEGTFSIAIGGPKVDEVAREIQLIANMKTQGKKILRSTIDNLPEDFGLRGQVSQLVGHEQVLEA